LDIRNSVEILFIAQKAYQTNGYLTFDAQFTEGIKKSTETQAKKTI